MNEHHVCSFCEKAFTSLNAVRQHEIRCLQNPEHISRRNNTTLPPLSEIQNRLLSHYIHLYPNEYNDFYNNKKSQLIQEGYLTYDAAKLAKIASITYLESIDEPLQIAQGTWACPICGKHMKDMGTHTYRIHELNWDDFVVRYNWKDSKIYFSDTYRHNLSQNKLNFYNNTESGKLLRNLQHIKMLGNNNPACRDDVKLKISHSSKGRKISSHNKYKISKSSTSGIYSDKVCSFGYIFWAIHNNNEIRLRSRTEYLIFLMLSYYNLKFEYEPFKIEYSDDAYDYPRHYIVDFEVEGRLFEVKPYIEDFNVAYKYKLINCQLEKSNKKLEIVTPHSFMKVFNIPQEIQKPVSYFQSQIIQNILVGNCKLKLPKLHDESFYYSSPFLSKLGEDPKSCILKGENYMKIKK